MTWEEWAKQADAVRVFLVEMTVQKVSDLTTQVLYLANYPYDSGTAFYIPCVSGLPRLSRQANNITSPNSVPSWGELEISLELDYRPDIANSLPWSTILGPAYNLIGQNLTIKLGGDGMDYADFATVFNGKVSGLEYDQTTLTLEVHDKSYDLERKNVPDYSLPDNDSIPESSRGSFAPIVYGRVKNYTPVMFDATHEFFMAASHILEDVLAIYIAGLPVVSPASWWYKKSYLPVNKVGDGSATMAASGTFTGAETTAHWLVQIDDVSAGKEKGQATFRWSKDNGDNWEATGQPTQIIAYNPASFEEVNAGGSNGGLVTPAGTYTGTSTAYWHIKIDTAGTVGTATYVLSKDGGSTWAAPALTAASVTLGDGMTAAFTNDDPPGFDSGDEWRWNYVDSPIPLHDGLQIQFTSGAGNDFELWDQFDFIMCSIFDFNAVGNYEVLVDVEGKISEVYGGYIDTPGKIIRDLVQSYAGWDSSEIDTDSFAAFEAVCAPTVGLYVDQPASLSQIIDDLLVGITEIYTVRLDGRLSIFLLETPSGVPVATLTDVEILSCSVATDTDNIYRRVYLNYDRSWQTTNTHTGIFQDWYLFASKEWRSVHAKDDGIDALYGYAAQDLGPLDTCLIDRDEAQAAATELLDMYKTVHQIVTIELKIQAFVWEIGDVVRIESDKMNLSNDYLVIGLEHDFTSLVSTVTLWR